MAGALGLIPPPFPFTAYVLAAGGVRVDRARFLASLAAARLVRTGAEAGIAARHGEAIGSWMESTSFDVVVGIMIGLAVIGTAWGSWRAYRGSG